MARKYGSGEEGDTRIVLNKEEEIRKLEYAKREITRQLEANMKKYAKALAASGREKRDLTKRAGGKLGRAENDFKGIKK